MSRRLWFRFPMGSERWSVYLVPSTDRVLGDRADEDPLEGLTVKRTRSIYINRDLPRAAWRPVLAHELVHAAVFTAGLDVTLGLSGRGEEQLAYGLASMLGPFLRPPTD